MRKIITVITLITTSLVFSQECKYKINEVDEFTKNKVLETKEDIFTMSGMGLGFSCGYSLKKINNTRYIKFHIMSPSIFAFREGGQIMFKTDKEDPIVLNFAEHVIAKGQYNPGLKSVHYSEYTLVPISEENYNRFTTEKIIKLRVYTSEGYVDDEVKEKRALKFQEFLKCI